MIERKRPLEAKIAVFGVGHAVYWDQFPGLYEKLLSYHAQLLSMLEENGVTVTDLGMVDSSAAAYETLKKIGAEDPDVVICNMLTYATSSVFAPIIRDVRAPVVLTALQPLRRMDYGSANTRQQLENDCICSVPEFTGVAIRMGRRVADVVIGTLSGDSRVEAQIKEWCDIARVLHGLRGARFGLMGHVLESMYDMHADPTAISAAFGVHVPLLEVDDVIELADKVTEEEIAEKRRVILENFDTPDPGSDPVTMKLTEKDLRASCVAAAALDRLVDKYSLDGLAYYYNGREGTPHRDLVSAFIVGNSLLNAGGVPMCGEFDIKTCIAMFIMDRLGIGGSFAEFHPFDFEEDFIFVGHDGPHHIAIADGKPVLRSLRKYHGKPGSGASVEFRIRRGPITMLGITQTYGGKFKFVIGEGESEAGPIPPTGNTNTRGFFGDDCRSFIKRWVTEGPTHHFALGVGHHAETIKKIADHLGVESVIVR